MSCFGKYIKRLTALVLVFSLALSPISTDIGMRAAKAATVGKISNIDNINSASNKIGSTSVITNPTAVAENNRAVKFTIDGTSAPSETGRGIFSVKDSGGNEYFYKGESITADTTAPGVYYNGVASGGLDEGWYFVYPGTDRSGSIQVQVLDFNSGYASIYPTYLSQFSGYKAGDEITDSTIRSALRSNVLKSVADDSESLKISYINYSGVVQQSVKPAESAGATTFPVDALKYYVDSVNSVQAVVKPYYGNRAILPTSDYRFNIFIGDSISNSPGVIANTNCFKLNSNMECDEYLAVGAYSIVPETGDNRVFYTNASAALKFSGSKLTSTDQLVKIPDEGIYIPLARGSDTASLGYITAKYISILGENSKFSNSAIVIGKDSPYDRYGPKTVTYSSLEAGDVVGLRGATKFEGTHNSSVTDKDKWVLGEIVSVEGSDIGSGYSDDYVTITPSGQIIAKQASGALTYNLVTRTKYTKFMQDSGNILYSKNGAASSTDYDIGYQTWNVTISIGKITAAVTEAPVTEATTAATTEKSTEIGRASCRERV